MANPDFVITPQCPELETKSQPFWVDSRSVSNNICHVVCYDRMSRADADFSTSHDWKTEKTMSANNVLIDICRICGFKGSSMTGGALGGLQYINFTQSDVVGKTCGEILDIISEAMVGVYVCSGDSLHLAVFGGSEGSTVRSSEHTAIEYQGRTRVIGLVMKNSSTGKTFSYGTTSGNGAVIQVESGFVCAELADIVKNRVLNYEYAAWNCEKADITTKNFGFGGLLQFAYSGGSSDSLESPLFPRAVNYSVDSTGIYFSGGCPAVDELNYKSKLEREKIGIGKAVGNTTISENGDIIFVNKNNEGGGLDGRDNGIGIYVNQN
ncbi:MAG: hypothetical protein K2H90_00135 [Oscillospiraceae bacterium]|nr:hypothetical protein [Oscillospiraceae bacterium]